MNIIYVNESFHVIPPTTYFNLSVVDYCINIATMLSIYLTTIMILFFLSLKLQVPDDCLLFDGHNYL
uniref:Uncharacterized protein n=1 Tax=Lepeophtheirus salmonis TaxID=72036 RepID=A0A0K2T532_LEPSM